jgi:hypothetical protein
MLVTCHTDGCDNAGITIPLDPPILDGAPVVVDVVLCGVCGQTITDVTTGETFPTDAPPLDA